MSKKSLKIRDQARDEIATAEWSEAMSSRTLQRAVATGQVLGALKATLSISRGLSLGGFLRLRQFVQEESYRDLGYQKVEEFFASDDAPMSKHQYYDRCNALAKEGEQVFDVLNSMDISLRNRKLLSKGDVRIDGDEVVVGHEEREERLPLNDRMAVKTLIATLVESKLNADLRIQAQEKEIKIGKKDLDKWKRKADEAVKHAGPTIGTPHGQALLTLSGAYAHLREAVADYRASLEPGSEAEVEFEEYKRSVMNTLGACYVDLSNAFETIVPRAVKDDDLGITGEEAADLLES